VRKKAALAIRIRCAIGQVLDQKAKLLSTPHSAHTSATLAPFLL
jgi:hypothetical protein